MTETTATIVLIIICFLIFTPIGMFMQEKLEGAPEEVKKAYKDGYQDGIDKLVSKVILNYVGMIHIETLKYIANELQEEAKSNGKN